jgi:hypothetical protein
MRIIQAVGLLLVTASCGAAAQPNLVTTTAPVANQPSAAPAFGHDVPAGGGTSAFSGTAPTAAPDPTVTDGDKYHVILENSRVRVLRYQDKPGDKTKPHHHAEFVLYALSPFSASADVS